MNGRQGKRNGSGRPRNGIRRAVFGAVVVATLLAAGAPGVSAQSADTPAVTAVACPRGIWVYVGDSLAAPVAIFRSERGRTEFVPVGEVSPPVSRGELDERVARFAPAFPGLPVPGEEDVTRLWEELTAKGSAAAFVTGNVPVTHLAAGSAWLDTTAAAGSWVYRVRRDGRDSDTRAVAFPAAAGPAAPGDATARFDGKVVHVSWPLGEPASVGGLLVRRRVARRGDYESFDGSAGFALSNREAHAELFDTDVPVGTVLEYELTLVDRYANPGAPDTALARTFPSDGTPIVSWLEAKGEDEGHRVRVKWELSGGAYAGALSLQRSASFDGPFETIATLEPVRREYEDTVPEANENAYYRIIVSGAEGASVPSVVVAAMVTTGETPLAPQSVAAEPDPEGIRVSWRGEGPYLIGYRVYRALGPDGPWELVSDLVPADSGRIAFTDRSADLSPHVPFAYVVRSVNDAYAESEPSEVAVASPPGEGAPSPPMNLVHVMDSGNVRLFWDDLSRTETMLFGYDVFRREEGRDDFALVSTPEFAPRRNRWIDSTATPGTTVEYRVEAVDLRGARSASSVPLRVHVPGPPPSLPPSGLRVQVAEGGVHLAWDAPEGGASGVRIYRSDAAGTRVRVADLPADATSYTDSAAPARAAVLYTVATLDALGTEGTPSAPVAVRR